MNSTSRRSFLSTLAAGAAFLPTAAHTMEGLAGSLARARDEDEFWTQVRQQFAFTEHKIPLNAANLCPSPRVVAERVSRLTEDIDVDCSFNNRSKFRQLQEEARTKIATFLGVSPDEIALVRNTSEANNTINNGLALSAGDEVVVWDQNHPTNNVAWDVRAARFGIRVVRVSTPARPAGAADLVKTFADALTPRTRVLTITHVSNVSGIRLPAREIVAMARARNIHVHLDGAQSLGAISVNLREIGCDSYSSSAHKWFVGPKEVGVLYVRADRIQSVWPNVVAPGWGDGAETVLKGARKLESLGQRDDAAVAAMATTVDFHQQIGGAARVEARVMALAARLKSGLAGLGAKLVTPESPALSAGVVIVEVPNGNRQKLLDALYDVHGIAGSSSGGLRLCPHLYNTEAHVDRAIAGVQALRALLA